MNGSWNESAAAARTQRGHMRYVWMVSLIAAIGGLLFGYDFVVIGDATSRFREVIPVEERKAQRLGQ